MLTQLLAKYLAEKDGATAIEYGLIAAGIALAISAAVVTFGEDLSALFDSFSEALTGAEDTSETEG